MILGIGSDMADIARIEKALARFGERFERRVFTTTERAKAHRRAGAGKKVVAGTYAKRFAAKEACAKALGTGMRQGVFWRDIEIINAPSGQPTIHLSGGALRHLQTMIPQGMRPSIQLSMSDEYPYAQAFVTISALPLSSSLA